MVYDRENLAEQSGANLQGFLSVELDLGFTFTKIALTERALGNMEHFNSSRRNAMRAAEAIRRFQSRLPEGAKEAITKRCSDLEKAISAL